MSDVNLYCVIVTYKDRWSFVQSALDALNPKSGISIVLVNNGSSPFTFSQELIHAFREFHVINSPHNNGSAWGYAQGIQYVVSKSDSGKILLLDDDNLITEQNLSNLLHAYDTLTSQTPEDLLMVAGWRKSRAYMTAMLGGYPVEKFQYVNNEFLGFSLQRLIRKVFNPYQSTGERQMVKLFYAPYGGLLFSSALIAKIGLPDARYFVYADDFEFSSRCTKAGGQVVLVRDAIVEDLEQSWQKGRKSGFLNPSILNGSPFRVYYAVRNFIIFQQNTWVKARWKFLMNGFLYTIFLFLLSISTFRFKAFAVYFNAVRDGLLKTFNNNKYIND